MSHRLLTTGSAVAVVIAVVLLATIPVKGQAPGNARSAGAATADAAPKTPDGQPDLQGFWTNSTYTPMQRAANVNKEFFTLEEVIEAEKRAAEREAEPTVPGTVADVHYAGTEFGLDKSMSGFKRNLRTSLITDPRDGKLPPMTDEGKARVAEVVRQEKARGGRWDQAQNNELDDRCIITGHTGPPMLNAGYNSNYQITQGPGYVMILVEMMHHVRMIPLTDAPRPPVDMQFWTGVSRGRWEGDTLVVETTNIRDDVHNTLSTERPTVFRGASKHMHVTERFRRIGADEISYTFTVTDPATWTKPWTAEMPMKAINGPLFEHGCHEGNFGLYNTLLGARADDRKAAEAAQKSPR